MGTASVVLMFTYLKDCLSRNKPMKQLWSSWYCLLTRVDKLLLGPGVLLELRLLSRLHGPVSLEKMAPLEGGLCGISFLLNSFSFSNKDMQKHVHPSSLHSCLFLNLPSGASGGTVAKLTCSYISNMILQLISAWRDGWRRRIKHRG